MKARRSPTWAQGTSSARPACSTTRCARATVTATSPLKLISMGHFEVKRLKKDAPDIYKRIEELVEERKG